MTLRVVPQGMFAGQAGAGQNMEEQMAAMMNSPVMQSMMDNPELLRTVLQSNPGIQQVDSACCICYSWHRCMQLVCSLEARCGWLPQVMAANPDFAQMLNNPEMLRESLRLATNPVRMLSSSRIFNVSASLQPVLTQATCAGTDARADAVQRPGTEQHRVTSRGLQPPQTDVRERTGADSLQPE